ncbi:hypothetical protein JCM10213v2_005059 [Rhodosporidiobolus nylandii]
MAVTATASSSTEDFARFTSRRLGTGRERVRSVAWNLDGRRLATGGQDKSLRIYLPEKAQDKALHFWDIRQGSKPTSTVETHGDNITMTWSPDGKTIVLGNRTDRVLWVDVESQQIVHREDMTRETNEAIFSHNGSLLITGVDGAAHIRSFPSNTPVHNVEISNLPATVFDLDPRGRYLAAGSNDTTLTLWETEEWTCVASSDSHDDPVRICRFSPDGNYIASSGADSTGVVISDLPSLKKLYTIPNVGQCDSLAWHPTKNVLAYGGQDACMLWGAGV